MLRHLAVDNYALIDKLEMTLGPHLNIITGETGAGKSILLGALGLMLGTRGEAGVQKDPERNCVVEGVFALDGYGLEPFFATNDLEYDPTTTIRRIISPSGKSRAYINDLPVQLTVLRELAGRIIDIHSQHQNLLLGDDRFRTSILDSMAGQADLVKRYGEVYTGWKQTLRQLAEARLLAETARRDEEYIRHQANELASARLVVGEQEALEAEERELTGSDEIRGVLGAAVTDLGADETGIVARLGLHRHGLDKIAEIYPRGAEFAERLGSVFVELSELEREMTAEVERIEANPARLATVTARLDTIYSLGQKHRVRTVAELIDQQHKYEEQLRTIERGDEDLARLEATATARHSEALELVTAITSARRKVAPVVEQSVVAMLRRLGIPEASLVVEITPASELRANGADEVRFLFSANASLEPRPIEKIASGGEVSRVMLALKALSAKNAGQPTIIFDEIDTGVSGQVADAMGDIIAELAGEMQVVNITHLPQIAAKEGVHFHVYKEGGATHIRTLSPTERIEQIASMLSGSTVTATATHHARELLKL
jgi:DNA repair protein RecN (Recombination protein N)